MLDEWSPGTAHAGQLSGGLALAALGCAPNTVFTCEISEVACPEHPGDHSPNIAA